MTATTTPVAPATATSARRALVPTLLATSFGFALIQLDVTIVNVALPRIGTDLQTGVAGLQWVVDAYALVFAVLLLTAGYLGDRYGARRAYLAGLATFAAASLGCGFATDIVTLVAGRALQGIGAAAMLPASLALLNHASGHDTRLRAWAIGWWTAAGTVTIAAGPIIGGLILGVGNWRLIFLVNLPICACGALLAWRVPETERAGGRTRFDVLGQVLAIVALAALIASIIEAKPLRLIHPLILGGFALGIAAAASFVAVEARVANPMLPLSLFRAPGLAVCVLYGIAANLTYYGAIFVLSLYLQRENHYGAMAAGLAYLPLTALLFVSNVLSGRITARVGSRLPMIWGALIDAAGFAALLPLASGSPYVAMLPAFVLMPLGMGTGVPAMTTGVLASVPKAQSGIAAAVLNSARQAGGAAGVAIFGALAGDGIVHGLHLSAVIAVGLLLAAALMVANAPRPPPKLVPL